MQTIWDFRENINFAPATDRTYRLLVGEGDTVDLFNLIQFFDIFICLPDYDGPNSTAPQFIENMERVREEFPEKLFCIVDLTNVNQCTRFCNTFEGL